MIVSLRPWRISVAAIAAAFLGAGAAQATPSLLVDADSGEILQQEQANVSWYPASLTKLMTAYVALHAVKDKRISLDTPLLVSARAARSAPSKMGFRPGTQVTLDNALKMLMVKSANDIAVTIAEGVSGSVEDFATEMNADAARLGMHESYFDNPNGLPDEQQVSSARDMAILARALYSEFPDQSGLFGIGALQLGNKIIETHNGLLGRYPGADGMKTGFTCAAGFNVVASATRGSRHLIAVVLGASTVRERNLKAAQMFEAGFSGSLSSLGRLSDLPSGGVRAAPNMRGEICTRHPRTEALAEETEDAAPPARSAAMEQYLSRHPERELQMQKAGVLQPAAASVALLSSERPRFDPVPVFVGPAPGWTGTVAGPRSGVPETASPAAAAYAPDRPKVEAGDAAAAAAAAAGPTQLSGATSLVVPHAKPKPAKLKEAHAKRTRPVAHAKIVRRRHVVRR